MRRIGLVVVDPHDLSRNGIELLVSRTEAIDLLGSYEDFRSCEAELLKRSPNVLLLDDSLPPSTDVSRILQRLRADHPQLSVIILSNRVSGRYIHKTISQGASGFIIKSDRLQDTLVTGIETVYRGGLFLSPNAIEVMFANHSEQGRDHLNSHDREVLHLIEQGYTTPEMAAILSIHPRSVYRIRNRLRAALGVRTNEMIIDAARQRGWLGDSSAGNSTVTT